MDILRSIAGLFGSAGSGLQDAFGSMAEGFGEAAVGGISGAISKGAAPSGGLRDAQGITSSLAGSNPPPPGGGQQPSDVDGAQSDELDLAKLLGSTAKDILTGAASGASVQAAERIVNQAFGNTPIKNAKHMGQAARTYLENAHPGTSKWDKLGQGGAAAGVVGGGQAAASTSANTAKQTRSAQQLGQLSANTSLSNAGLASVTSRLNTADQLNQNKALIEAQVATENAKTAAVLSNTELDANRRNQIDASADAAAAGAESSRATADQTRQLTPLVTKKVAQEAENLKYPGRAGNIINPLKSGAKEIMELLPDIPTSPKGSYVDDLINFYGSRQPKHYDGIKGATHPRK